jgi:hypothetical protein
MIKIKMSCGNTNIAMALIFGTAQVAAAKNCHPSTSSIVAVVFDSVSPVGTVVRHKGCTATDWECNQLYHPQVAPSQLAHSTATNDCLVTESPIKAVTVQLYRTKTLMTRHQSQAVGDSVHHLAVVNAELAVSRATVESSVTEIAKFNTRNTWDVFFGCQSNHTTVCGQWWTDDNLLSVVAVSSLVARVYKSRGHTATSKSSESRTLHQSECGEWAELAHDIIVEVISPIPSLWHISSAEIILNKNYANALSCHDDKPAL